ncbi:beta-N-acetylhexosaminidase, partial [uncultured Duncaniella sp.]
MRKLFRLAGILTVTGALAACSGEKTTANYHTIPIPQEIKITSEGEFVLNSGTKIIYPDGNEKMRRNAMFLAEYLKKATGTDYDIATGTDGKGNILLQLGHPAENPEAYRLNVTQEGVTISGTSEAGVFYGVQTLRKSIPVVHKSTPVLAAVEINDYPRFGYRGVHFDISRHFFTVEEAKSYI